MAGLVHGPKRGQMLHENGTEITVPSCTNGTWKLFYDIPDVHSLTGGIGGIMGMVTGGPMSESLSSSKKSITVYIHKNFDCRMLQTAYTVYTYYRVYTNLYCLEVAVPEINTCI